MVSVTYGIRWNRLATAAAAVAVLGLAGCGGGEGSDAPPPAEDGTDQHDGVGDDEPEDPDDGADDGADHGETASADAGDDVEDGAAASPDAGESADDVEPIADGGDTDRKESEGESPGVDDDGELRAQAVTEVRVASHEGFDRVVFELESDGGMPGWFVEYDEPTAQGSGNTVEVDGDASLTVMIHPVSLPPDLPPDIETWDDEPVAGPEGGIVQEIVGGPVYEGYHQFFVGTDERRPFAVVRLEDPPRVVLDIFREQG